MERRRECKQGVDARFALELALGAVAMGLTSASQTGSTTTMTQVAPQEVVQVKKNSEPEIVRIEKRETQPEVESTPQEITPQTVSPADEEIAKPGACGIDDVRRAWPKILNEFEENKSLISILKLSKPVEVKGNCVFIRFEYPFHEKKMIKDFKNKELFEKHLNKILEQQHLYIEGFASDAAAADATKAPETVSSKIIDAFGGQVIT